MSRERVFAAAIALFIVGAVELGIVHQAAKTAAATKERELMPAVTVFTPKTGELRPVFQCTGAGAQLVLSLGGDGSSLFAYCDTIKP